MPIAEHRLVRIIQGRKVSGSRRDVAAAAANQRPRVSIHSMVASMGAAFLNFETLFFIGVVYGMFGFYMGVHVCFSYCLIMWLLRGPDEQ